MSAAVRMLPVLGRFKEQGQPPAPTPQFYTWPALGELLMAFELTSTQETTMSVTFTDKRGNPVEQPEGTIEWKVNSTILALVPAADGLSCVVSAAGPVGAATVSVTLRAPDNSVACSGSIAVDVVVGPAANIVIDPGVPVEQPGPFGVGIRAGAARQQRR